MRNQAEDKYKVESMYLSQSYRLNIRKQLLAGLFTPFDIPLVEHKMAEHFSKSKLRRSSRLRCYSCGLVLSYFSSCSLTFRKSIPFEYPESLDTIFPSLSIKTNVG